MGETPMPLTTLPHSCPAFGDFELIVTRVPAQFLDRSDPQRRLAAHADRFFSAAAGDEDAGARVVFDFARLKLNLLNRLALAALMFGFDAHAAVGGKAL